MGGSVNAGNLDQQIVIQALTVTFDGMGASVESYATAAGSPAWAEYIPLRGLERIEAGKLSEKEEFKLKVRRWAGLTRDHRVVYAGQNHKIIDIEDGKRSGYMVITCRAGE
jgi:SPP1 family predicted phage head-tail adaptor